MKHLFIVNPVAGKKGSTDALLEQIHRVCGGKQLDYEIRTTSGVGDACHISRGAAETGGDVRIYACGGDGTLNEAVNGAAGYENAAITVLPKGTGNDFLKIFGKDCLHTFSDLDALVEGPQTAFDLMDCNGKLGVGVTCAGVDARIADDVHKYKDWPLVTGMGAYILALIENVFFKGIARRMQVRVNGAKYDEEFTILCVCNGRYYGGGFMPVGEAEPDDGVLNFLVVPKVSRFKFFRLVGVYAKGDYKKLPNDIFAKSGQSVTFSSPLEIVAVVDGEVMRDKSFTLTLSHKKVNFFYPPNAHYRVKDREFAGAL
ncbi:MAG: diacylglycerol kinase family protein [Oscillospiraceae bacterium]